MDENANMVDTSWAASDAALTVWLEMRNTGGEIARRICTHVLDGGAGMVAR
jgi:hypothetical protein